MVNKGNSINNSTFLNQSRMNVTKNDSLPQNKNFCDLNTKWPTNTNVYASSRKDEFSHATMIYYSYFTNALTNNMVDEKGNVNPLSKADEKIGDELSAFPFGVQHPQHSKSLNSKGWISKKKDPNRKSKAILIQGDRHWYDISPYLDVKKMHDKLINDYGLTEDDIQIEKCPTIENIERDMKKIQNDGGDDSQVLIFYSGDSDGNILATNNLQRDCPENMDKKILQYDVNKYLSNYTYINVVLDCCNSESLI